MLLRWNPSTDDRGVAGYRLYLDGTQVAAVAPSDTSHLFTGLAAATNYTLQVRAFDAADNASAAAALPWSAANLYRHGDTIRIDGTFGSPQVTHTFLGGPQGPVESQAVGARMPNGNGWVFSELGHPTRIAQDPVRGKVLFTPEDSSNYNATRRFDPGAAIAENRFFYKAHWVRNVMLLDGQPYAKSYQWKHERVNWENSVVDGDTEIKVHNQIKVAGLVTYVNRSRNDKSTYWNSVKAPDSNGGWALMEIMVYTGTQGQNDGKLITRLHKDGKTWVNQNRQAERIYADPNMRLRYFIEHRGATLTRDTLLNDVWGYNTLVSTRTVDVHVAWLRQKLEANPHHPQFILTVHGIGYKFVG